MPEAQPSPRTIERLSLYRRMLLRMRTEGKVSVYSRQIAAATGVTAAQVRRDLMTIGYSGSPNRGYEIEALVHSIADEIDERGGQNVCLVGVGNLGRAVVGYVRKQRPNLHMVAVFDKEPNKCGLMAAPSVECHHVIDLPAVVRRLGIRVGIITVPAQAAQEVADALVGAGIKGILNFAPVSLRVPPGVHVEDADIILSLEKVAYYARNARNGG